MQAQPESRVLVQLSGAHLSIIADLSFAHASMKLHAFVALPQVLV
jgi:hypothetical protein